MIFELFAATLRLASPVTLAALGGVLSERVGVVNIALESKLLGGAFAAVAVASATRSPWAGLLAGVFVGAGIGALHAALTQRLKVEPILSGVALNLIALGATSYGVRLAGSAGLEAGSTLPAELFVGLAVVLTGLLWLTLYRTPLGLRIRACGERPQAVLAAGVDVWKLRLGAVTVAGALAGLGGAGLALVGLGTFSEGMSAGRGFLALAAVILGRWHPLGAVSAALLFGFGDALQVQLQTQKVAVPSDLLQLLPYVLSLGALGLSRGRSRAPASLGQAESV